MAQPLGLTTNSFAFDNLLVGDAQTKGETLASGSNSVGGLTLRGQILGKQSVSGTGGAITSQGAAPIASYTVVNGGSGYTSAPTVTVHDRLGLGAGAVPGAVTLVAGVITAVALGTAGSRYTDPVAVVTGGGGVGALITPVLNATTDNTAGSGAISAVTAGDDAILGVYVLRCTVAAVNGGTFVGTAPDGETFGQFIMSAGAAGANPFVSGMLNFTITDATDFVVGDSFRVAITGPTAAKVLVRDPGAKDGSQIPYGILVDATDASAADTVVAVYVAGMFNQNALTGFTEDIREALRSKGIFIKSAVAA